MLGQGLISFCTLARTSWERPPSPQLACAKDTSPGLEYLSPPRPSQSGALGAMGRASHYPEQAGASPEAWSQFLGHQRTRGALDHSMRERVRFSHGPPRATGTQRALASPRGVARADSAPASSGPGCRPAGLVQVPSTVRASVSLERGSSGIGRPTSCACGCWRATHGGPGSRSQPLGTRRERHRWVFGPPATRLVQKHVKPG